MTCFLVQVFPTPLKFGKVSAGRAPPSSLPYLVTIWRTRTSPQSHQQHLHPSARTWLEGRTLWLPVQPERSGQNCPLECREGDKAGACSALPIPVASPLLPMTSMATSEEGYLHQGDTGAQTSSTIDATNLHYSEFLTYLEGPRNKSESVAYGTLALQTLQHQEELRLLEIPYSCRKPMKSAL